MMTRFCIDNDNTPDVKDHNSLDVDNDKRIDGDNDKCLC